MTSRSTRVFVLTVALLVAIPAAVMALGATDPRRSQLWWFDRIGVEGAWDASQGEGVVVAVLDTGAQLDHPDLVGQFATTGDGTIGRDLVDDDSSPTDPNGHGTIVAGLVAAAANNGEGVAGVAPAARILPVRVLDAEGRGVASAVDAGIRWAVDNGADVINLSLEVEETDDGPDATLTAPNAAIEYAWQRGVVVVAATGNSGGGAAGYPVGSPVVLVGATARDDELASFSDADRLDAVMAPGVEMVSTWCQPTDGGGCNPDARYGIGDGTSFAAPVASGVVALLLGTGLDHEQAVQVLRDTAEDLGAEGPDERFGVGRIDAAAAVAAGASLVASAETPERSGAPDPSASTTPPAPASEPAEPTEDASPVLAPSVTPSDGVVLDLPDQPSPAPSPSGSLAPSPNGPLAGGAPEGEPTTGDGALSAVATLLLAAALAATVAGVRAVRRRHG